MHLVSSSPLTTKLTRTTQVPLPGSYQPAQSGMGAARVCQLKGVTGFLRLLPACAEAAVEGDVEGVQRGLPAVGPALPAAAGGVEADDDEVEVLEGGLLGGEVAAGLDRAAEPGVQRLDRVGGADQRPDLLIEPQEGHELGPGALP